MTNIDPQDDKKHEDAQDEDYKTGEASISGSEPDPESDDDVLEAAHGAGLYQKDDGEHPQEVGIAEQVGEAEKDQQEE